MLYICIRWGERLIDGRKCIDECNGRVFMKYFVAVRFFCIVKFNSFLQKLIRINV